VKEIESGDLEELDATLHSRGYALIRDHLECAVQDKIRELIQPSSPEKTAELRGAIAGIQSALGIPALLRRDLQAAAKKAKADR
jgi:hypothetical protein